MLKARYGADAEKRVAAATRTARPAPDSPLMQVVKTIVPANPLYAVSAVRDARRCCSSCSSRW